MARLTRRTVLLGTLAMPAIARAQTWPSGTITLVVPYTAGGSNDVMARLVQPELQRRLGVNVIVENRPGGGTSIGAAVVAKAPRDGSKWLINADPQALNPSLMQTMPYQPGEIDPLLLIGTSPNVIATHAKKPYRTLADVIAAAKTNPAGDLVYGVIAETIGHVALLLLAKRAGVKFTPVTYRGGAQVVTDAVGGHVEIITGSAALIMPHVEAGTLRAIAQMGPTRHPAMRDVPTVAESGFADFSAVSFWGWFAPSGTPQPILQRFEAELRAAFSQDEVKAKLSGPFMMELPLAGPAAFAPFFEAQVKTWGAVIRENGIRSSG